MENVEAAGENLCLLLAARVTSCQNHVAPRGRRRSWSRRYRSLLGGSRQHTAQRRAPCLRGSIRHLALELAYPGELKCRGFEDRSSSVVWRKLMSGRVKYTREAVDVGSELTELERPRKELLIAFLFPSEEPSEITEDSTTPHCFVLASTR